MQIIDVLRIKYIKSETQVIYKDKNKDKDACISNRGLQSLTENEL